jgi:internalin A
MKPIVHMVGALILASAINCVRADEVSVPDTGLNTAIREALQKPVGPLTAQDLLSLTNLIASGRSIANTEGLQAAANLLALDLRSNSLASLSVPSTLTNLATADVSSNPLTTCLFPDGLRNLNRVLVKSGLLTNLTLPSDLTSLIELNLAGNRFTNFDLPSA